MKAADAETSHISSMCWLWISSGLDLAWSPTTIFPFLWGSKWSEKKNYLVHSKINLRPTEKFWSQCPAEHQTRQSGGSPQGTALPLHQPSWWSSTFSTSPSQILAKFLHRACINMYEPGFPFCIHFHNSSMQILCVMKWHLFSNGIRFILQRKL